MLVPKDNRGNYQCESSHRFLKIMKRMIDYFEYEIQFWDDEQHERQAYKDIYEVRKYLRLEMSPIVPENSTLH